MATGTEIIDQQAATGCSMPALTPSMRTVLDKAYDAGAAFSAGELALIEPLAAAVAPVVLADASTIRKSLASLSSSLPDRATDEIGGKLKLGTYITMLDGCDAAALASACRRCLDELDWFPTVHQLKVRVAAYVSPEQHAINLARHILRTGRREAPPEEPLTAEQQAELEELRRKFNLAA